MKLYTEEQVRQMLFDLGDVLFNNCQDGIGEDEPELYFDDIIAEQTPIELPSDEKIENRAKFLGLAWVFFYQGAKWVINHIKQQDNERV